jgi:hypothetical protein
VYDTDLGIKDDFFPENDDHAIRASIAKWKTIVKYLTEHPNTIIVDGGRHTCALCFLYWSDDCKGCPVHLYTGQRGCATTPYEDYFEAVYEGDYEEALHFAQKEVEFQICMKR